MIAEKITNKTVNRLMAISEKIDCDVTGLRGAIYVHVDFLAPGKPDSVSFSHKQKDDSTLDKTLVALGDTVTSIIRGMRDV